MCSLIYLLVEWSEVFFIWTSPFSSNPFLTFLYIYTCCSIIFLDLDMNRHPRNRGGRQGHQNPRPTRHTTRVNAPLRRGANFKIDSHILGLLPTFHGLPSEDPYRHVDEFSQVCEFNQFHNVPSETAKMRFSPFTLKERANEWFFTLGVSSIHGETWKMHFCVSTTQ